MRALEVLAPAHYTPQEEAGKERPARFLLKPLTGMEWLEVCAEIGAAGKWTPAATKAALRLGLRGWENFCDSAGPVPFLQDFEANLARLPVALITELRAEIERRTYPAEEDKKK